MQYNQGCRLLMLAGFVSLSVCAYAAEDGKDQGIKLRPSTTLSAAASAANSAVSAANAAAAAASAAANAAAAAVAAINAILPPSQRISTALPVPSTPPAASTPAPSAPLALPGSPQMALPETTAKMPDVLEPPAPVAEVTSPGTREADVATKFSIPAERSLIGLVGAFEIPVAADARGNFAAGVASVVGEGSEPVETISAIDLAQAVKASMGFSRDVLVASARVDQARAQTGQARAFLLPSLLVTMKSGREISTPGAQIDAVTGREEARSNHSRTDKILTLKQPLLDMQSLYDWKRREVVEQSREQGMRSSAGDTYLATVNAYLAVVSSRLQANMAMDYESQLQELFQYIEKRAGAGAASNADKERVRARSLNARSARIEQEAAQAAAGVEFVRLVNLAPSTLRLPDLEEVGISIVPPAVEQAMPLAIQSNPDIALLEAELRAAELDQSAAKSRYLPRVDLEYQDSNSLHAGGGAGDQRDQRLMVVMNWSLFNGGGDLKYNDEKAARRSEIKYRLDDQRRRVLQSLSAQYATLESTRERIASGYRELESIATAAKSMSSRMVSGNQSLLDMLDVYDRYYQARTRLVNLHVQEMTAVAQIARLVQGAPSMTDVAGVQPQVADQAIN